MAKSKKKKRGIDPLLLIGIIFVVFVAIIIVPKLITDNTVAMPKDRVHVDADFNTMGTPDAPLSVVIYSDFQCSHCNNFYQYNEEDLINQYVVTGLASYEFRSFGESLGPESGLAAQAAYCAGDQGAFWDYHDVVYENFSYGNTGGYSEENLIKFADKLNLDTDTFESCLVNGKYAERVAQDQADGRAAGVNGTPSIVVNGELKFPGNVSIEDMQPVLDGMLADLQ